jgi:hypothetical protein
LNSSQEPKKPSSNNAGGRKKIVFLIAGGVTLFCVFFLLGYIIFRLNKLDTLIRENHGEMRELVEEESRQLREQLTREREELSAELAAAKSSLEESVEALSSRTQRGISDTRSRVEQTRKVYAGLLEEQKKKTLEDLYDEQTILAQMSEAKRLFEERKYRQAHGLYVILTGHLPENQEMWFHRYYSLFLLNRSDRQQYRQIREGLTLLERQGYTRPEIREILMFIETEENGILPQEAENE